MTNLNIGSVCPVVCFGCYKEWRIRVEERVALIGIVVEKEESIGKLNEILHQYGKYIIGRMGIPYHKKSINVISIAIDAPSDIISALSGKLGMLPGVSAKAVYQKLSSNKE